MVQVMENRSVLHGQVEQVDRADGTGRMTVRVEAADPVPGFANLLRATVGRSIVVILPAGAALPAVGDRVRTLAHAAGPDLFYAIPDGAA